MQTPTKKFKPCNLWSSLGTPIVSPGNRFQDDLPADSPKPLLHVLNKQNQLTTKKSKFPTPLNHSTLRRSQPRFHSSVIKPRLSSSFHYFESDRKAHVINFQQSVTGPARDNSLSKLYDESKKELYFTQCFDIQDRIGSGSFADVFKASSKEDHQYYAIKVARDKFRGAKDRERKLREVAKHQQLDEHPHMVRYYKAWEEKQRLFIQTELCLMSLSTYAELNHDIDESTVRKFVLDLLKAVAHLHEIDLIHLDIKPENIFISQNGACKLGDFGLMYDLQKDTNEEATDGDPKYLAPEVIQGTFTKSADIFSLGMTILELATDLDLPNGGSCWHDLRENRIPEEHLKKMSPELSEIIKRMLDQDYTLRPTARELLEHPFISSLEEERQNELSNGNFKVPTISPRRSQVSTSPNSSINVNLSPIHSSPSFQKNNISAFLDCYSSDESFHCPTGSSSSDSSEEKIILPTKLCFESDSEEKEDDVEPAQSEDSFLTPLLPQETCHFSK